LTSAILRVLAVRPTGGVGFGSRVTAKVEQNCGGWLVA
jgi:hypothetical protein